MRRKRSVTFDLGLDGGKDSGGKEAGTFGRGAVEGKSKRRGGGLVGRRVRELERRMGGS